MNLESLILLVTACLAVNLSPGPSMLFVSSITVSSGLRAGIAGTLGMSVAALVYVVLAATGVAAVLATSPLLFTAVQISGAIYLFYLGNSLLRSTVVKQSDGFEPEAKVLMYFKRGIIVDLFNPKLGLFFLAFIPPFLGSMKTGGFWLSVAYGCVFILTGCIVNGGLAFAVASGRSYLQGTAKNWITQYIPGVILILLSFYLVYNSLLR